MRYILVIALSFVSACQQSTSPAFADRVASAEALENTPAGALFIGALIKEHEESINSFATECYANSAVEKDSFTLVADIDQAGNLTNVVVQPESPPTLCYAEKFARLHTGVSRPANFTSKPIPLVLNVHHSK